MDTKTDVTVIEYSMNKVFNNLNSSNYTNQAENLIGGKMKKKYLLGGN